MSEAHKGFKCTEEQKTAKSLYMLASYANKKAEKALKALLEKPLEQPLEQETAL